MYIKVHINKYLSCNFPIQNGRKQDGLSPLPFNFPILYAIKIDQESRVGLKLNGTYQLLVYVHDVNLLDYNIDTKKEDIETLLDASK
jgi:hypothetical protein